MFCHVVLPFISMAFLAPASSASGSRLLRLHPSPSQHPPSLALLPNLVLPSYRPVSPLLTNESDTCLQYTRIVPQYVSRCHLAFLWIGENWGLEYLGVLATVISVIQSVVFTVQGSGMLFRHPWNYGKLSHYIVGRIWAQIFQRHGRIIQT